MEKVSIYGLQRSGTNYLKRLLETNFWVEITNFDYRHSFYKPRENGVVVVIYKELEHWEESLMRNSVNFFTMYPDAHYDELEKIYTPWLASWAGHGHFIRYESLLESPNSSIDYLGTLIGQEPKSYDQPDPKTVNYSNDWKDEYKERYI